MFSDAAIEKFKSRIYRGESCWILESGAKRYAYIGLDGRGWSGHRASYIIFKGSIPKGLYVCHTCDNTKCVNPEHLFLGTALDNNRDRSKKCRSFNQNKTHCIHGHALVEGNYYFHKKCKTRYCLECRRTNDKNRKRSKLGTLEYIEKCKALRARYHASKQGGDLLLR